VLLDGILSGETQVEAPPDPARLRLGVPRSYFYENLESAMAPVIEGALARLANAGVTLVEADIDNLRDLNDAVSFTVVLYEAKRELEAYLREHAPAVPFARVLDGIASPDVKGHYAAIAEGDAISEGAYRRAIDIDRPALQKAIGDYLHRHNLDGYVVPATCLTARPVGDDDTVELNGARVPTFGAYIRNTDPSSNAGTPSVALPAGMTDAGLPVGIMIEGAPFEDRKLLATAAAVSALFEPVPPPRMPAGARED
jgi:mandelamide amidase